MNPLLREKLKEFFKTEFADAILNKLKNGYELKIFNINPFVTIALASGVFGKPSSINMAKALLLPRVLGTSVSTTFGDKMQKLCASHLGAQASSTQGMDIEFGDKLDGKRVIMQLKAGPNTINRDDVEPIIKKMNEAYRLLRQNRVSADEMPTFAIGITYGSIADISGHYKTIHASSVGGQMEVPIMIGQDFWHRLTGDADFYSELSNIFMEVFAEEDYSPLLEDDIQTLASEIENKYFTNGKLDATKI